MYQYPIKFTFPLFSVSPQFEATDASGRVLFSASKKLLSSKDEISITTGGKTYFKVISQESRITDIPSNWDVMNSESKVLGVVDDDFLSAIDTSKFIPNRAGAMLMDMQISRTMNLRALKMYWIKDASGNKIGLIAPDQTSLYVQQLPLYDIVRKLPIFYRFITPRYYIRLGEETVLYMEKQRTLLQDIYTVQVRGNFTNSDEPLLINSIVLAVLYERERLKELYT